MAFRFPFRTKSATSTTGTGTYTLTEPNAPGWRTLTQAVAAGDLANGDTVAYLVVDTTADVSAGGKVLELCTGVWNNVAKTLTRATVIQPNGTPVSWGAGTRDVLIVDSPTAFLLAVNNLSDVTASTARTNLGLGSAAVLTAGTGANNAVQLNGSSQLPAVDGSLLTGMKIPSTVRVAADQAFTSTVLAAVTGLTQNVSAGVTYHFVVRLHINNTSTGGYKFALTGTATATAIVLHGQIIKDIAPALVTSATATALAATILAAASTAGDDAYLEVEGTITVNAGGTLLAQFAQNGAAGTTTVRRGSTFELVVIP